MRLHSLMPNFSARTTRGPIQLYDWQGDSWVLLISHPSDFTPVCTTELGDIAKYKDEFANRNVKVLAHSVDDLQSHFEWADDIRSYCLGTDREFPFPIIADPDRSLAVALEMIDESQICDPDIAQTVRAMYVIDPSHRLRLSLLYPMSTGRCIKEIIRSIDSLQLTDRVPHIATPADWVPGGKVMIQPQLDDTLADEMFPKGVDRQRVPSGKNYMRSTTIEKTVNETK